MIALYARNSPDEILTRVGLYVIPKAGQSTHQNKSQTPLSSQLCAATWPRNSVMKLRYRRNWNEHTKRF